MHRVVRVVMVSAACAASAPAAVAQVPPQFLGGPGPLFAGQAAGSAASTSAVTAEISGAAATNTFLEPLRYSVRQPGDYIGGDGLYVIRDGGVRLPEESRVEREITIYRPGSTPDPDDGDAQSDERKGRAGLAGRGDRAAPVRRSDKAAVDSCATASGDSRQCLPDVSSGANKTPAVERVAPVGPTNTRIRAEGVGVPECFGSSRDSTAC